MIMCKSDKCPWPFSVQSKAEATVVGESSLTDSSLDMDKSATKAGMIDQKPPCTQFSPADTANDNMSLSDCKNITEKLDETHEEVSKDLDVDMNREDSRSKNTQKLLNPDSFIVKTLPSDIENIVQTPDKQEVRKEPSAQDYSFSSSVGTHKPIAETVDQVPPSPGKTSSAKIDAQSSNVQIELSSDSSSAC